MPEAVCSGFDAPLDFSASGARRYLAVSLGIFSVVRIVRPAQYLIQATEYCIPEKECTPVEDDDPCHVFRKMPFPVNEFCTGGLDSTCNAHGSERPSRCGCNG